MNRLMTIAILAMAGVAPALPVLAHDWNHPSPAPAPSAPVASSTSSSPRTYHYTVGYRNGGSGYNFRSYYGGQDYRTGYSGSVGQVNTPHRSDWNAYLNRIAAQRKAEMASTGGFTRCGFTNSPADCYTVNRVYPPDAPRNPPSWNYE